jgi:hypothetical protein
MSPSLAPLRAHPVYTLADILARYVGVERDLVQFVEFLSLAAGRMVMPVNLDIQTDRITVDLFIANRILDLRYEHVARVDTHRQFRDLERAEFHLSGLAKNPYSTASPDAPRPLAAVLVRGNHRFLNREVSEYTARLLGGDFSLPSLWRVSDLASGLPPLPACLRVQGSRVYRGLDEFGEAFAGYRGCTEELSLGWLLESLPIQPSYRCPFRPRYRGKAEPEMMLLFERLLTAFVALRLELAANTPREVTEEDYAAVRALLTNLPLTAQDRNLPPQALATANVAFEMLRQPREGIALPDLSEHGQRWFTRHDAVRWTRLGYNTVKSHLEALEGEGILRSTVAQNNRERGRLIHFRFAEGRAPPFGWENPFLGLPDLTAPVPAGPI